MHLALACERLGQAHDSASEEDEAYLLEDIQKLLLGTRELLQKMDQEEHLKADRAALHAEVSVGIAEYLSGENNARG